MGCRSTPHGLPDEVGNSKSQGVTRRRPGELRRGGYENEKVFECGFIEFKNLHGMAD